MRLSTAQQMMDSDRKMAEEFGMPTLILMEHAALALMSEMEKRNLISGKIIIVCGKGNNGGDGYALARLLKNRGCDVSVVNAFSMAPSSPDAMINYRICRNIGVRFTDAKELSSADVIVDAIFGIGMNNRLNDFCSELIKHINESGAYVVSVDLPSGAYGDSAYQKNTCVEADLTVTFASYKPAVVFYPSAYNCGEVVCCDIGIKDECFGGNSYIIDRQFVEENIPVRKKHGHKGTFGRLLCIGGSVGLTGAVYMCGQAGMKAGCGTVKLCVPEKISDILEIKTTEVMTVACPDDGSGQFSESGIAEIVSEASKADAVVFGCGIGRASAVFKILKAILESVSVPVIIDADGLHALSRYPDILKNAECPVIITPHIGEMSRLCNVTADEIMGEPIEYAVRLADKYGVAVCLKSARTVIAMPDSSVYVNIFGNSGMAKGGSGDCLAGIIGSLAAQGADLKASAVCGVGIHALAGDVAAEKFGEYAVTPTDIIEHIGAVLK